jgi:hypothetical protein
MPYKLEQSFICSGFLSRSVKEILWEVGIVILALNVVLYYEFRFIVPVIAFEMAALVGLCWSI